MSGETSVSDAANQKSQQPVLEPVLEVLESSEDLQAADDSRVNDLQVADDDNQQIVPDAHIGILSAALMVNLTLTSRTYLSKTREFKAVETQSGEANFYHPLRPENREKDPKAANGVAIDTVSKAFELVDTLNSGKITLLGEDSQISENLQTILHKMLVEVESTLPFSQNSVACGVSLTDPEMPGTFVDIPFMMKDIVRVSGWINHDGTEDHGAFRPYSLIVNVTLDAGHFYDQKDPQKYVSYVQSTLARMKKSVKTDTAILIGVTINPSEIALPAVRDLLAVLCGDPEIDENVYSVFSRSELQSNGADTNWAPQTRAQVDKDLLTIGGDVLLVKAI